MQLGGYCAVINIYTFYNAKFKTCTTVSMDGKLEMGLNPHQNNSAISVVRLLNK